MGTFGESRPTCHGDDGVARERKLPTDPVAFIQGCVRRGRLLWTYHLNMRAAGRFISRESILAAVDTFEVVEA